MDGVFRRLVLDNMCNGTETVPSISPPYQLQMIDISLKTARLFQLTWISDAWYSPSNSSDITYSQTELHPKYWWNSSTITIKRLKRNIQVKAVFLCLAPLDLVKKWKPKIVNTYKTAITYDTNTDSAGRPRQATKSRRLTIGLNRSSFVNVNYSAFGRPKVSTFGISIKCQNIYRIW